MNSETPRKPRSDCLLKNLSAEQQEEIAEYGRTHSVTAARDWIVEQHKIRPGRTAVGEFLASVRMIDKRYENKGAISGLLTNIETDAPELSPEELQARAKQHFAETVIHDSNVSAFNQSERNAIRREELEIQRQELAVEREQLELKRKIFERDSCEWIVKMHNHPKIREVAVDPEKSFAEKVTGVNTIMFGKS